MSEVEAGPAEAAANEPLRDEATLRGILRSKTTAVEALQQGLALAQTTAGTSLGVAIGLGTVSGLGVWITDQFGQEVITWSGETLNTIFLGMVSLTVFLTFYAVLQFAKRETASLESWLPALFALPTALASIAFYFAQSGGTANGMPVTQVLLINAFSIVFGVVVVAPALVLWLRAGQAAHEGKEHDLGETLVAMQTDSRRVMVVRGAKLQAILVGIQVLLPGIFYALQLAFAEMIVVLRPQQSALRRSGQLTWGMRGRIFRLLALVMVLADIVTGVVLYVMGLAMGASGTLREEIALIFQAWFVNPGILGLGRLVVQDILTFSFWWVGLMAVLVLFNEREHQVDATRELKKLRKAQKAAEAAETAPA